MGGTSCDVTKKSPEEVDAATREGASTIDDALMKELYPKMPVILIKALPIEKIDTRDIYLCPVYKTQFRGPTYVFTAGLKTKTHSDKWIMAGVAFLLAVVE